MNLLDIKTIYICPDHNEKYHERKLHMDNLLTSIGFTNFSHYKSGNDAYPKCLCDATIDILKNNLDEPILILEDDIELLHLESINIPTYTDAIYFGISRYAGHPLIDSYHGDCIYIPHDDKIVRVGNMLSTHAILYISKKYKETVIATLQSNIKYNSDVIISRIQKDFNIYALKIPFFYQSSNFGNFPLVEYWTKFKLE